MLSVRATLQTKGLGKRLLHASEKWASEVWKCTSIEMEVISIRTELVQFYLRRGFEKTGETAPFPYGDERFGIPKVQNLEFIVLKKNL